MTFIHRKTFDPADGRSARGKASRRHGFTLVEVLATLMLIAIVLPAVMKGISLATSTGTNARRRTEAVGLAESKLNELIVSQQWQGGQMSGDFSPDWPDYHWQATVQSWPQDATGVGIQEVDLEVTWLSRNQPDSVKLSTLTYVRATQ
jgi:general secretion pathway protein I